MTRAYVTNEDSGDVTVIDVDRDRPIGTIAVGKRPRGIRVSPDKKTLFIALSGSPKAGPGADERALPPADRALDGIAVVDVASEKLLRVLPAGQDPEAFDSSRLRCSLRGWARPRDAERARVRGRCGRDPLVRPRRGYRAHARRMRQVRRLARDIVDRR